MTTWAAAATSAAALLETQYREKDVFVGNFWFGGNALQAYLGSCLALNKGDEGRLLEYAFHSVYEVLSVEPDWWHDDFGWWGNVFCLALKRRKDLGYAASANDELFAAILAAAGWCWEQMDDYWRDKPYNTSTDNSHASADISGGTFNDSPDSSTYPMSGRNSVTNEGFWLLSLQLAELTGEAKYENRAKAEYSWFVSWLNRPSTDPGILNDQGLVLERPTGHALIRTWHWSGDQGLFMAAYLQHLNETWPPPYTDSLAAKMAESVMATMVHGGILRENMSFYKVKVLQQFLADYATGKGIFMRNLAEVSATLGPEWTTQHSAPFIGANAAAVWNHRDSNTGQLPFNWNPDAPGGEPHTLSGKPASLCKVILQASGLDALSAAVICLPDENIP